MPCQMVLLTESKVNIAPFLVWRGGQNLNNGFPKPEKWAQPLNKEKIKQRSKKIEPLIGKKRPWKSLKWFALRKWLRILAWPCGNGCRLLLLTHHRIMSWGPQWRRAISFKLVTVPLPAGGRSSSFLIYTVIRGWVQYSGFGNPVFKFWPPQQTRKGANACTLVTEHHHLEWHLVNHAIKLLSHRTSLYFTIDLSFERTLRLSSRISEVYRSWVLVIRPLGGSKRDLHVGRAVNYDRGPPTYLESLRWVKVLEVLTSRSCLSFPTKKPQE